MISRRLLLAAWASAPLAACNSTHQRPLSASVAEDDAWFVGTLPDKPHDILLVDRSRLPAHLRRQVVEYSGSERPGTIVVDIDKRHLFLVQEDGKAMRYGIGVGRDGFSWRGTARVGRKGVWPAWSPTATMVRLRPELPRYMEGGNDNPLGARALYLYQGDRDILFRIHGTNEPWTIGQAVSSGCIRLLNEDIVDLYKRVEVGTTVLVKRGGQLRV